MIPRVITEISQSSKQQAVKNKRTVAGNKHKKIDLHQSQSDATKFTDIITPNLFS